MNDHEIFFLIVAAWLHDWGMVTSAGEDADLVRKTHHIRTEKNFEELYHLIHLNYHEARIIGKICKGHRNDDLYSKEYENCFFGSNIPIRISFLASLLRIADECDITANRTPEIVYYSIKPEGASETEFKKHLSIGGIGQSVPYKIGISAIAYSPQGVETIEGVKKKIQSQLDSVRSILASNEIFVDIVETQIDTRGFINKPIAFELDRKHIVDLLIGRSLYSRKDVAIRELIQNSIDTCRLCETLDRSHQPTIKVVFSNDKITFMDNGVGMNFDEAKEHFSKKGNSFYLSDEFKKLKSSGDFDPISNFGIGVLSCFLIADKMEINTKKEGFSACNFSISNFAEGWTYKKSEKDKHGTEITLYLNGDGKKMNLDQVLTHYIKAINIPISLHNLDTGEIRAFQQKWDYEIQEVIDELDSSLVSQLSQSSQSNPDFVFDYQSKEFEVKYYIFKKRIFGSNNCFLSNQGIYVGSFDLFPSHSHRWIVTINTKSDLIDLTLSREDIIQNERYEKFLDSLYISLFDAIDRYISQNYQNEDDLQKCLWVSNLLNILFISSFGTECEDKRTRFYPKLVIHRIFPVLTSHNLLFMSGKEILDNRYSKIYHYKIPAQYSKEHIKTVNQFLKRKIQEDEILIYDLGPCLQLVNNQEKYVCSLCDLSKISGTKAIECIELSKLLPRLIFDKENTALDPLLPAGSFFTRLPENLKGLVIEIKPFIFSEPLTTLVSSESQERSLYKDLVSREIFRDDIPAIFELYTHSLWYRNEKEIELESYGIYAFDTGDIFIKYLLLNSSIIILNPKLTELCKRYFKLLLLSFFGYRRMQSANSALLIFMEKTLAEFLEYPDEYIELEKRMGNLASIYNETW
jgi:hypothetical protein